MRDYSKVGPRFWTGDTGKYLRRLGRDSQVIGFYLFTCPSANMIGLYYLGLPTLTHETGVDIDTARQLLHRLSEAPSKPLASPFEGVFARYDEDSETVFVTEMARHQIGEHLTRKDNRHKAVLKELEQYRKSPFFNDFVQRYREDFELQDVILNKPLRRTSGAPSKPEAGAGAETGAGAEAEETQNHVELERAADHENASRETDTDSLQPDGIPESVARIFAHWRQVHEHPRAQLDAKRRKLIRERLKQYSEADLCQSISGYRNSPYHMGDNDRSTVYDDIELMLRDSKHVDAGLKFYAEPPRTDLSPLTRRNVVATDNWIPPEMRDAPK